MKKKITVILTHTTFTLSAIISLFMLFVCVYHVINTPYIFPKIFMAVTALICVGVAVVLWYALKLLQGKIKDLRKLKPLKIGIISVASGAFLSGSTLICVAGWMLMGILHEIIMYFSVVGVISWLYFCDCMLVLDRIKFLMQKS